jgi:hypothetical protein
MTKNEPVAHGKMAPKPGSPPDLETDGRENVVPLSQRTKDDQEKALAAGNSVKDPDCEAENPSPMPRSLQGRGGHPKDNDPEGQQGGTH